MDPVNPSVSEAPVDLTQSDADIARLLLRFRLYTFQPDEMITLMALAGMRPGQWELDPRLYQYGGLFIYPVGALLKLCGALGWIDVRNDVAYYLDHPEEFAKFYLVARVYSASWGLIGVLVVCAIGRRLGGNTVGYLSALLFSILPVVVCMSHEAKPHLPGAVLMLAAVWSSQRFVAWKPHGPGEFQRETPKIQATDVETTYGRLFPKVSQWLTWILCGAATGMVLSSTPILILILIIALIPMGPELARLKDRGRILPGYTYAGKYEATYAIVFLRAGLNCLSGIAVASITYLLFNPYILINLFKNRDVLRSNFGNSLAMYEVARIGEGLKRVLQLTAEGASWPVVTLGALGLMAWLVRRIRSKQVDGAARNSGMRATEEPPSNSAEWIVLVVPAAVFFLQFVLIGAGKPGEYGRFGIFPNAALAIGAGCVLATVIRRRAIVGLALTVLSVGGTAWYVWGYLSNFRADAIGTGSRMALARLIQEESQLAAEEGTSLEIAVLREPAPYSFPPIHFAGSKVVLYQSLEQFRSTKRDGRAILLEPVDVHMAPEPSELSSRYAYAFLPGPATPISWANKPFQVILDPGR
jgi:hypothetical protein